MTIVAEKIYTPEEYFELEKHSEERHEFVHGNLILMPGESKIANKITGNCYFYLRNLLENKGHDIFIEDVRLMVNDQIYRYPDLVVASEADNQDTHAITQPSLVIEVLSDSTQETDKTDKLREYCSIPSLQYYLLIEQNKYLVECYGRRQGKQWIYEIYESLEETIELPFFEAKIELKEIYQKILF